MEINVTEKNILGLFLLITVIVMEANISLQQHCLPKITSQHGYALTATQYKTFTTQDYPTCMMECKKDELCMSMNYHLLTKTCELNTQTKESLPEYYKKRPNSIYTTNTAFRTPEPAFGLSQQSPAKSCLEILNKGSSIGTGVYWIDPASTGNPMQAYCDMTTDGGGWTIVKKTILQTTIPVLHQWPGYDDINLIKKHNINDKWVIPKVQAMNDIKNKMGFQQIHYYCHKKSVGRVLSIMTKNNTDGQAVVTYLTGPPAATVYPKACGSFDRLPEDTSVLSQNCAKWGTAAPPGKPPSPLVNQWGYHGNNGPMRTVVIPMCMNSPRHLYGGVHYDIDGKYRYLCDDPDLPPAPYTVGDIWQVSVR